MAVLHTIRLCYDRARGFHVPPAKPPKKTPRLPKRAKPSPLVDPMDRFDPDRPAHADPAVLADEVKEPLDPLEFPSTEDIEQANVHTVINYVVQGKIEPKAAGVVLQGMKLLHEFRSPKPSKKATQVGVVVNVGSPQQMMGAAPQATFTLPAEQDVEDDTTWLPAKQRQHVLPR